MWAAPALHLVIGFLTLLATFTFLDRKNQVAAFSRSLAPQPVRWIPLTCHLLAITAFAFIGVNLYQNRQPAVSNDLLTAAILVSAAAVVVSAALATLPRRVWIQAAAIPGAIWGWALGAAILVTASTTAVRTLWLPASNVTFRLVRLLLRPLVSLTIVDPARMQLGTSHFRVIISPECSGLEGISLLLLFGSVWLILFRKECRFPQAFLVLPLGAMILFGLNSVRIAALLLIGDAGAKQIAAGGFHSEAGWITFNAVSLGLCVMARRVPWFTIERPSAVPVQKNGATEVYLMPLLSILAAGMAAQAVSGGFQWFYPLRAAAPVAVIWLYRREYARIDWRPSSDGRFRWLGPAAGGLVFVIWIGLDRITGTAGTAAMPSPLRDASIFVRAGWTSVRAFSTIAVVPFAEELAFRGFLIRRVLSAGFDALPTSSYSWPGILISSAVFGALHGDRWPAGVLAGLIYGFVFLRRGRLGDAIVAHATTNALLAVAVLFFDAWQYW